MPAHTEPDALNAIARMEAGTADDLDREIVESWSHRTGSTGNKARKALESAGKPQPRGFLESLFD